MSWTRNAVYDALLARLQAWTPLTTICPAANITRRLPADPRSPEAACPYLAIVEIGEETEQSKGTPALDTLDARLIGGLRPGQQPDEAKSPDINDFLDAIRGALAPDPVTGFQTLGDIVSHCWVEGRTGIEEGLALANPSLVEVPIRILVGQDNDGSGRQFVFDVGEMFATLTGRQGDQAAPTLPTVVRFGGLKGVRLEGAQELTWARSGQLYAISAARKYTTIEGTAQLAAIDSLLSNQIFFGEDTATGGVLVDVDRPYTLSPATSLDEQFLYTPGELGVASGGLWTTLNSGAVDEMVVASNPPAGGGKAVSLSWTSAGAPNMLRQFTAINVPYTVTWVVQGKSGRTHRPRIDLIAEVVGFTAYQLCQVYLQTNGDLSVVDATGTHAVTVGMTDDAWHEVAIAVDPAGVVTITVDAGSVLFTGAIVTTHGTSLVGVCLVASTQGVFTDESDFALVGRVLITSPEPGVTIAPPNSGTFAGDLGVAYAATGAFLTRVSGVPSASGTFSLTGSTYLFAAADRGVAVKISYTYSVTVGQSISVTNRPGGLAPTFKVTLRARYNGRQMAVILNRCVATDLVLPEQLERFMVMDFKFQALADTDGNVGRWSFL